MGLGNYQELSVSGQDNFAGGKPDVPPRFTVRSDIRGTSDASIEEGCGTQNYTIYGRLVVPSKGTPEAIAASWAEGFTHPSTHRQYRFRYLVHGLQSKGSDVLQKLAFIDMVRNGDVGDIGENIDLLMEPHRVGEKPLISASAIDQNHRATFGKAGLILRTPPENVLDVFSRDGGTDFGNPDRVIAHSQRKLCTVEELMEACKNNGTNDYNEVTLVGTTKAGKVQVVGFWIKVDERGRPLDQESARQLLTIARRDRIPYIRIVDIAKKFELKNRAPEVLETITSVGEGEQESKIKKPRAFAVNRNGLRYVLDFENNRFSVVNDERKMRHMTPDEFAYAKGLIDTELDPAKRVELEDILLGLESKYQEFHRQRLSETVSSEEIEEFGQGQNGDAEECGGIGQEGMSGRQENDTDQTVPEYALKIRLRREGIVPSIES